MLSIVVVLAAPLCRADSLPLAPAEKGGANSATGNRISLGDYADIDVPADYHFIAAGPARVWLERMNNPVDPGLLGVLVHDDSKWIVVLEFDEMGCPRNLDSQQLDPASILKAIQDRHQPASAEEAARIASIKWQIEPKYDSAAHSLEWALRAQTPSVELLNHSVALLGRRGVLQVTVVQPIRSDSPPVALDELAQRVTFKPGETYDDYQAGDKLASAGFKDIIIGDQPADAPQNVVVSAASVPSNRTWIYAGAGGVVVVLVVGIAFFAVKKTKPSKTRPVSVANGHAVPAFHVNGNGNGNGNGHGNGKKTMRAANGNGAARKKKMFNYSKFYTDMVMGLSGNTYAWVSPGNGQSSRPRSAQAPAAPASVASQSTLASANSELIASQRNLIEEQRNLMREQSRLIEEKARLLKEYNQLVEKWSQDIGNQFSLKLD